MNLMHIPAMLNKAKPSSFDIASYPGKVTPFGICG